MPTSNLALAPLVVSLVHDVPHRAVLDVGPGWGKYAVLLREYLNVKPERIDAVEAWPPYIADHRLGRLYDVVYAVDVCDLDRAVLAAYDVVLMVDVIEHIEKGAAVELLARIPGRVVVCTPRDFFSNGPGLPPTETHRSHWTPDDFEATGRAEVILEEQGGIIVRLGPTP